MHEKIFFFLSFEMGNGLNSFFLFLHNLDCKIYQINNEMKSINANNNFNNETANKMPKTITAKADAS